MARWSLVIHRHALPIDDELIASIRVFFGFRSGVAILWLAETAVSRVQPLGRSGSGPEIPQKGLEHVLFTYLVLDLSFTPRPWDSRVSHPGACDA